MRHELVEELLKLIVSFDRSPFPDGAVDAWFLALDGVDYRDAHQAVLDHYGALGARDKHGAVRRCIPADIRTRSAALREQRERALLRQLPAAPAPARGVAARSEATTALLRANLAKASAHGERVRATLRGERVAA